MTCEHGVSARDGRYDGRWAAPWSTCECCGITFFFVDSGEMRIVNGQPISSGRNWTRDRCRECGGHHVEWTNPGDSMLPPVT